MHPFITDFKDRPLSHKAVAAVASYGAIVFLFWIGVYKGRADEAAKLADEVAKLEANIKTERKIARNLEAFRKEVRDLEVKLNVALQELPDKREIPDLLSNISNLARDAGLEVSLFKPNPTEIFRDFYAEVPVSISVEGTYHQVASFFDEVGRLPRIVNINQITVRDPAVTDVKVSLKTDCTATTFRYLDESERQQVEEQQDNRRRRRR